jgi:hypothetical protein
VISPQAQAYGQCRTAEPVLCAEQNLLSDKRQHSSNLNYSYDLSTMALSFTAAEQLNAPMDLLVLLSRSLDLSGATSITDVLQRMCFT